MDRKDFLTALGVLPLSAIAMQLKDLERITETLGGSERMPVLFIGHGNPMNAITDTPYGRSWAELGKKLPKPKAILCISAHWLTNGTAVNISAQPKTIHDFGGFPDELFKVHYPAPGSPEVAKQVIQEITSVKVQEDLTWGLDHGAWSILKHIYPQANVPVFQMSIDYGKSPEYHYKLGKELSALRNRGVLILSSGNIVHNLGMVSWNDPNKKFDWAIEFDTLVKEQVLKNDPLPLIHYQKNARLAQLAHPTNDHYLPLMYTLGLRDDKDQVNFLTETIDMGSISMRSILFG
ncbi:MAG: 4,5-DOPA dioxygenase extradiol [Bacteroidia bacterium]|jgi:4,5-DOPA dioxygenase extradiol|nr:4,5-DOPA dioxygenase extradiol [Bacteroidia bacterium]